MKTTATKTTPSTPGPIVYPDSIIRAVTPPAPVGNLRDILTETISILAPALDAARRAQAALQPLLEREREFEALLEDSADLDAVLSRPQTEAKLATLRQIIDSANEAALSASNNLLTAKGNVRTAIGDIAEPAFSEAIRTEFAQAVAPFFHDGKFARDFAPYSPIFGAFAAQMRGPYLPASDFAGIIADAEQTLSDAQALLSGSCTFTVTAAAPVVANQAALDAHRLAVEEEIRKEAEFRLLRAQAAEERECLRLKRELGEDENEQAQEAAPALSVG